MAVLGLQGAVVSVRSCTRVGLVVEVGHMMLPAVGSPQIARVTYGDLDQLDLPAAE